MPEHVCGNKQQFRLNASILTGPTFPSFQPRPIPHACLEHMIEGARRATPLRDAQPWRWIVVRREEAKQQLEAALQVRAPLGSAPVVLICLADTSAWKSAPKHLQEMVARGEITEEGARETLRRLRDYYSASPEVAKRVALAGAFVALHHLLAAAAECGISASWLAEFDEASIKTHFHIPERFLVAAVLPLGYSEETAPAAVSQPASRSLVYCEKFGEALAQGAGS